MDMRRDIGSIDERIKHGSHESMESIGHCGLQIYLNVKERRLRYDSAVGQRALILQTMPKMQAPQLAVHLHIKGAGNEWRDWEFWDVMEEAFGAWGSNMAVVPAEMLLRTLSSNHMQSPSRDGCKPLLLPRARTTASMIRGRPEGPAHGSFDTFIVSSLLLDLISAYDCTRAPLAQLFTTNHVAGNDHRVRLLGYDKAVMVYCGKPSKGCQTCRNRRIKCDETRPTCAQCARSKRVCTGYRDEVDLLFRNENKATEIRAQRSAAPCNTESNGTTMKKPQTRPVSSTYYNVAATTLNNWRARNVSFSSSPRVLPENAEQHALCHFFTTYVPTTRHSEPTFLGYLLPVWREAGSESALSAATSTVALMGLGNAPERNQLVRKARQNYSAAISKLNAAISDPVEARRDETLLSVLLFSLYQKMVGTPESLVTWTQHTDGAVALVKLRGKDILRSPLSLKLFLAVRAQMIINQTSKSEQIQPLSTSTRDWTNLPPSESENENTANRLMAMAIEIPNYRALAYSLLSGPRNEITKARVASLLDEALSFDNALALWPSTVPVSWQYKPFAPLNQDLDNLEMAYHGPVHKYYDIWVCSVWNDYRLARIFMLAIVLNCTKWLAPALSCIQSSTYKYATTNLRQMVDGICASVPFALGHKFPNVDGVEVISMLNTKASRVTPDQASSVLGGYSLMWPVFVASNVPYALASQRRWLRGRQAHIAKGHNFDQANVMRLLGGHVVAEKPEATEVELAAAYDFFMPPRGKPLLRYTA